MALSEIEESEESTSQESEESASQERPNEWEALKTFKTEFDDDGKAQAVQIRGRRTDRGGWSFSYAFGVVDEATGEFWSYRFVSDRFSLSYMQLFLSAISVLKDVKFAASKNPNASAAGLLQRRRGRITTYE